jgi:hypothetical protein
MTSPNQIGGFVSWNKYKRKIDNISYKWHKGKACINPITMYLIPNSNRESHKGFLFSYDQLYVKSFNIHLIDGAILVTKPHFLYRFLSFMMRNFIILEM